MKKSSVICQLIYEGSMTTQQGKSLSTNAARTSSGKINLLPQLYTTHKKTDVKLKLWN